MNLRKRGKIGRKGQVTIFVIIAIVIIVFLSDTHKMFKRQKNSIEDKQEENIILDSNSRKIINYIRNEMAQGNFPTIKELKFYLKISHPTLLLKLNELEKKEMISIKKKGRNKHLLLK